jgi:hypothetical protein
LRAHRRWRFKATIAIPPPQKSFSAAAGAIPAISASSTKKGISRFPAQKEHGQERRHQRLPEEIEDALRKHPAVMDVAVIGYKHPEWGEAVKAFVVLNRGAECGADALIRFCKESLAPYKAPKVVEFLPSLPRTGLGKIDRGKLEAMSRGK